MIPPRFIVIGNPENRRVTLFSAAVAEAGFPAPEVVPWISLHAIEDLSDRPALVRIDSFGENPQVELELLRLGHDEARAAGVATMRPFEAQRAVAERGRIVCPRQQHFGLLAQLRYLEQVFVARPRWKILNPPSSIAELFDKRITSRKYAALGIPVPRCLDGIDDADGLRAAMIERGWKRVFIKLSSSSSASCLAIFQRDPSGAEWIITTMEQEEDRFYNSLRLRRTQKPSAISAVLTFLLREGSQIEEGVAKDRLDGFFYDLRVLVIDGEPAFTVVRQSRHPITNLHLGGRRGDLARLRERVPADAFAAAMESARRVHAAHATFHVGVDLLFMPRTFEHRVLEANAFGDLLPNLYRDGDSVYAYQVKRSASFFDSSAE